MNPQIAILLLTLALLGPGGADAGEKRDSKVRRQFLHSLGLTHTPKGCQVDHLWSLHLGGADAVENLCLICGDKLPVKEWAERRESTLRIWLDDNKEWLKKKGCRYEWSE